MPLRDHFHPPFTDRYSWDMIHGGLPMVIATALNKDLPEAYAAGPGVSIGSFAEIDIATFQEPPAEHDPGEPDVTNGGGVAVAAAVWAPPQPSLEVEADWSKVDDYEVKVYDVSRSRELVAAIEIVSPSNKDRPEHRRQFAAKCAALLANKVSVVILDFVTERPSNLYAELLEMVGQTDAKLPEPPQSIYAVACRSIPHRRTRRFQSWYHPLLIGQPLPTLPLWITERVAIKLDLEPSYEETLRSLRIK